MATTDAEQDVESQQRQPLAEHHHLDLEGHVKGWFDSESWKNTRICPTPCMLIAPGAILFGVVCLLLWQMQELGPVSKNIFEYAAGVLLVVSFLLMLLGPALLFVEVEMKRAVEDAIRGALDTTRAPMNFAREHATSLPMTITKSVAGELEALEGRLVEKLTALPHTFQHMLAEHFPHAPHVPHPHAPGAKSGCMGGSKSK